MWKFPSLFSTASQQQWIFSPPRKLPLHQFKKKTGNWLFLKHYQVCFSCVLDCRHLTYFMCVCPCRRDYWKHLLCIVLSFQAHDAAPKIALQVKVKHKVVEEKIIASHVDFSWIFFYFFLFATACISSKICTFVHSIRHFLFPLVHLRWSDAS